MFSIGKHLIQGRALLAPMAGATDMPFRNLCRQHGAALCTTEMVTADTRLWASAKSSERLRYEKCEMPVSVQIAGSEPGMLAQAAQAAVDSGADIVDINMGCPAKKVCKKLAGSALLKDEGLVEEILRAVVSSVSVPVTLKTRTGWSQDKKNCVNVAKLAEDCGIAAIAVHGRTRACKFSGHAEYDSIAKVVEAVSIPVIANGDINSAQKAKLILEYTGAAAIMVGRGALGNPWIFKEINALLSGDNNEFCGRDREKLNNSNTHKNALYPNTNRHTPMEMLAAGRPPMKEIGRTVREHIDDIHAFYGEYKGLRIARKHFAWYCKNIPNAKGTIKVFNTLDSLSSQQKTVTSFFERATLHEEKVA